MVKERNKTNPLGMDRVSHHMHPQLFQHDGIGEKFKKYKTNFFSVTDERACYSPQKKRACQMF